MISKSLLLKPLAIAALFVAGGAAQAAITVYTSLTAFTAAVGTTGTDDYTGFAVAAGTSSPIVRSAGTFSYTATVDPTVFYGAGTTGNPWLSTLTATDTITFNGFTAGVVAAGGNFFGSDILGSFLVGGMTLTATDASGSVSQTIANTSTAGFLGFVSTGALLSLKLCAVQVTINACGNSATLAPFVWPTADNLILASAAPVPEPETYAMLLAGLGALAFMARRRGV